MGMKRSKKLAIGVAAQTTAPANAPAPAPAETPAPAAAPADPLAGITSVLHGVNLTGLADIYYAYNSDNPPGSGGTYPGGTLTEPFSFRNNRFGLNLIELQLDKPVDKTSPLGFRVALGFGDAMSAINGVSGTPTDGTNSSTQYLKEGYLSYMAPIGKGLQLDFGKYVTPAGAEVIETNQNWNYSRSLLFYFAIPYYHFGARAKYSFNDKWSITGYANNGWNNVVSSNSGKTGGFSLAWNATKKVTLTETYLAGPGGPGFAGDNGNWNHLTDTVLAYNPTAKLSVVANFDYDHQNFGHGFGADYTGVAGYARYQVTPKVAVVARGEYFNDHDGLGTGVGQHLWETTGTIERTFAGHLISRLEYRHDESNKDFFPYGGPTEAGQTRVGGQNTVDIGLMFVLQPAQ
jgi:Putative beta-barrel porin-2, OmpL-like. bbp2